MTTRLDRRRRLRARARRALPGAIGLALGIVIWEVLGRVTEAPFLPPFSAVIARLAEMIAGGELVGHVLSSLTNLAIGFSIAVVVGVLVGAAMGTSRRVEAMLDMYVYALLTAPGVVFAPIFFTIFGFGRESVIAVIVIYAVFVIIIDTMAGIHEVSGELGEMARSFGASRRQLVLKVLLPAAMPLTFAGIRLGAGRAVKGMVNGEMLIAVVGLGSVVIRAGQFFDAESVLAILIVIVAIAFVVVWVVGIVERRATSWMPATTR
jgi:NitT/TauT family transport system permease protein